MSSLKAAKKEYSWERIRRGTLGQSGCFGWEFRGKGLRRSESIFPAVHNNFRITDPARVWRVTAIGSSGSGRTELTL